MPDADARQPDDERVFRLSSRAARALERARGHLIDAINLNQSPQFEDDEFGAALAHVVRALEALSIGTPCDVVNRCGAPARKVLGRLLQIGPDA